jgi:MinD superfamily P-loop ATPase containing an inserted ferredoxin domain
MIRNIIKIDQDACNGCGLCVSACHEDAIGLVNGKATLLRDDYCDGLGNCLPVCPTGAISFEKREAAAYDEESVKANQNHKKQPLGCPGTMARTMNRTETQATTTPSDRPSMLSQWPVQIKLAPVNAPYFNDAHLLVAADCTAYAYGDFHQKFIKNKVTLIGCPKLDEGDYAEKLTAIIQSNTIKSVTVVRMEVPCCGGIEHAAITALKNSGKMIPWQVITISTDGHLIEN